MCENDCNRAIRAGEDEVDGEEMGDSERCRMDERSEYEFAGVDSGRGRRWAGIGECEFTYED